MVAPGATYVPRCGDAIWLEFDPQVGREQAGKRPAIVLSAYDYNRTVGLAIVCPITSQAKGYPFEVPIPSGMKVTGLILADHAKSVDWRGRSAAFICQLPRSVVAEVVAKLTSLLG